MSGPLFDFLVWRSEFACILDAAIRDKCRKMSNEETQWYYVWHCKHGWGYMLQYLFNVFSLSHPIWALTTSTSWTDRTSYPLWSINVCFCHLTHSLWQEDVCSCSILSYCKWSMVFFSFFIRRRAKYVVHSHQSPISERSGAEIARCHYRWYD